MVKRTLEEKIKLVWIWALILSVVYFVIGAYLKSDGFKFDPPKTYELIKDTLTLTAAFLAPVAAFVLFSDWRKEHAAKNLEMITVDLNSLFKDLDLLYYFYNSDLESNIQVDILNFQHARVNRTLSLIRDEILLNKQKILSNNDEIKKFKEKIQMILYKTNELNGLYSEYQYCIERERNTIHMKIKVSYEGLQNLISTTNELGNLIKRINFE
ncbi:hypothetical protein RFI36_09420 [Acinetobacter gerneri]|uniref:Uncharacterized protein n=1 Tax=Acinetobacter gerneri TaxID=202952 RepID=A0AAW8JHL9_9GAMM|nr:hypothetical protein [Acinetobacter gerneri]MDQ9010067.1 hypothetical protein [Acinetobacter gerneri]MDQ9014011.1 hypothetical protein [Acinetobacter gerneri]MDQ9025291.1 hypothetical protein [Acinetobacter gerneri]MDQ9052570.1 hypothetical protein [Acinetobacter gerneri]MDQ9060137.1 hypothetical protein [Acinetobacter gerneri]